MELSPKLTWLQSGDDFPPIECAWSADSDAAGLLAIGADLSPPTLIKAYTNGIFPWFSEKQPILWWSPDPRMVLAIDNFKLHRSLRKIIQKNQFEIRIDSAFEAVILRCARAPRQGQNGTWITQEMMDAYIALHRLGFAHSVETWFQGELVGGLYCINIGKAVFGESMFTRITDASKVALAALVAFCKTHQIPQIDCQQNTPHLASLGASECKREQFQTWLTQTTPQVAPSWHWNSL